MSNTKTPYEQYDVGVQNVLARLQKAREANTANQPQNRVASDVLIEPKYDFDFSRANRTYGEAFSDNFHKAVDGIGQTATNLIQLGIGATEFGLAVATGNGDEVANKLSKGVDNVTGFANSMTGGIILVETLK